MKTSKQRVLVLLLLFCAVISLSACGKQDPSDQIIGSWVPVKVNGVIGGQKESMDADDWDGIGVMTFNEDGSFSGFDSSTMANYDGFYWQIKGETIVLSNGNTTVKYSIIELDSDTLIVRLDLQALGGGYFNSEDYLEATYKKQG